IGGNLRTPSPAGSTHHRDLQQPSSFIESSPPAASSVRQTATTTNGGSDLVVMLENNNRPRCYTTSSCSPSMLIPSGDPTTTPSVGANLMCSNTIVVASDSDETDVSLQVPLPQHTISFVNNDDCRASDPERAGANCSSNNNVNNCTGNHTRNGNTTGIDDQPTRLKGIVAVTVRENGNHRRHSISSSLSTESFENVQLVLLPPDQDRARSSLHSKETKPTNNGQVTPKERRQRQSSCSSAGSSPDLPLEQEEQEQGQQHYNHHHFYGSHHHHHPPAYFHQMTTTTTNHHHLHHYPQLIVNGYDDPETAGGEKSGGGADLTSTTTLKRETCI
ncbi:lateral signaling target protein 2 homolog, partial [Uranotaenia lowii]|uniref:lateral signaling target protein 2 homolog n=1 Tax=Uranotaenia lowii TaxID=190385 RepID=UPI002478DA45